MLESWASLRQGRVQRWKCFIPPSKFPRVHWDDTRSNVPTGLHRRFFLPCDGDIIIDAGANVGVFSIHAYSLFPTARIIAYEPFPMNFKYLVENLQSFNASSVVARRIAVGKEASCVYIQTHGTR